MSTATKLLFPAQMPSSSMAAVKASMLLRFDDATFVRTKEAASKQNEMQPRTGLVKAIILEVKHRERIGGAFIKTDAICCNPALARDGSCTLGEVIIGKDQDNQ